MSRPKFDPDAAFRNIVGVPESTGSDERSEQTMPGQKTASIENVIIMGNDEKVETRSKRVNLVVRPSIHGLAKAKCDRLNISLNECINQFLEKWGSE